MTQDNRPPRYKEGDRVIYRASSLGMCDKALVALSMGYDAKAFPAWFQEVLDEGTREEVTIREMYETLAGVEVVDVGRTLEMEILEGIWLRGSIDGLYALEDVNNIPTLFEAKKIRDSGWAQYQRVGVEYQKNYPMQTSAYLHMLEEETGIAHDMAFVGGHYVNKGTDEEPDWQVTEVDRHMYVDPPVNLRAIKKRIVGLERLVSETKAIGDLQCGDQRMFPCPVYYLHDDEDEETPERPSTELIESNLVEWDQLETARLAGQLAEKRQKDIKNGVVAWLKASGQESGEVSLVKLTNMDVALKYHTYPYAEKVIPAGEATRVTIKVTNRDGVEVAKAPGRSKKKAPPNPVGKTLAEVSAEDAALVTSPTPAGRKLAPRPTS